jgi:hypothetical protein
MNMTPTANIENETDFWQAIENTAYLMGCRDTYQRAPEALMDLVDSLDAWFQAHPEIGLSRELKDFAMLAARSFVRQCASWIADPPEDAPLPDWMQSMEAAPQSEERGNR